MLDSLGNFTYFHGFGFGNGKVTNFYNAVPEILPISTQILDLFSSNQGENIVKIYMIFHMCKTSFVCR